MPATDWTTTSDVRTLLIGAKNLVDDILVATSPTSDGPDLDWQKALAPTTMRNATFDALTFAELLLERVQVLMLTHLDPVGWALAHDERLEQIRRDTARRERNVLGGVQ